MRLRSSNSVSQDDQKVKSPMGSTNKGKGRRKQDSKPKAAKVGDSTAASKAVSSSADSSVSFYISTEPEAEEIALKKVDEQEVEEEDSDQGDQVSDDDDEDDEADEVDDRDDSEEEAESEEEDEDEVEADDAPPRAVLGQKEAEDEEERKKREDRERQLRRMLFGSAISEGSTGVIREESDGDDDDEDDGPAEEPVATAVVGDKGDDAEANKSEKKKRKKAKKEKRKAVWQDDDDEDILVKDVTATYAKAPGKHGAKETSTEKYSRALKRKFVSLAGTPAWADLDRNKKRREGEDSDDEFFRETTDMLDGSKHSELTGGRLSYRKLTDLNEATHAEGAVIRAAEFHPTSAVAAVAGLNGTASLFAVDGRENRKLQSVHLNDFPVKTAHFSADGSEFVLGSQRKPYLHVLDLGAMKVTKVEAGRRLEQGCLQYFEVSADYLAVLGRFGQVHLLSAKTKEKVFSLKQNDDVTCAAFAPGGAELYTHGAGGEIYLWDVRQSRECVARFSDDGCVRGTALAVSPDGRHLAAGADSGVVNLYDTHGISRVSSSPRPKPYKTAMNLTTMVTRLKFNPTSEILAMASEFRENSVKLLHVPSRTVFNNFPSWNFNLRRVNCMDFSLNGGYFSVGNNRGAANLYRIDHYGGY